MRRTDAVTEMIEELGKEFPAILEPLIYERDLYMTWSLKETCRLVNARHLVTGRVFGAQMASQA